MQAAQITTTHGAGDQVTLLFTDIEGSTRLVQSAAGAYQDILDRHFRILRNAVSEHTGREVTAHSDAFFAIFDRAEEAVAAGVAIQRRMAKADWAPSDAVRVRLGLHTGSPTQVADKNIGYIGIDVHRAARIADAANGGQILMSGATYSRLGESSLPADISVKYAGMHRLKDLHYPENLYEVVVQPGKPFPPVRSVDTFGTNLPRIPSKFIGREQEITELRELLRRSGAQIVTLTGPGGAGKTRLSVEATGGLTEAFPAGVFQVLLGGISEPHIVAGAIAQTLGVHELPGSSSLDSLKNAIANKSMLLVLDNFEQVIDAAPVLSELTSSCKRLKLLVTSREALRIAGEVEFRLAPLHLPGLESKGAREDLLANEAVSLFADRARQADPRFVITPDDAPLAAEICRRLDGLPLAIELAASRMKLLSMQGLLDRMGSGLKTLGRGPRDVARRHSTLHDTVAWSYDLLSRDEQGIFAELSVFVDGFNLAVADCVCGRADVLDLVSSLSDKSLLRVESIEGEPRFRMLETIKEFGLERLAATDAAETIRARHAECFLDLAEKLAPGLVNSNQRRAVGRLLTDADNIRAAISWSLTQKRTDILSRLLRALLWFWIPQSRFTEGKAWMERALPTVRASGSEADRAVVLDVGGWLRMMSGDYAGALSLFEEAFAAYEKTGSDEDRTRTLMSLGITTAVARGDMSGVQMITDALSQYQAAGNLRGTGLAFTALGEGARGGGDIGTAAECYGQALEAMRSSSDMFWTAALLINMGQLRLQENDWETAQPLLNEALAVAQEYNYPMVINVYVAAMGRLALCRGRPAEAAKLFGAIESLLAVTGVTFEPADQAMLVESMAAAKAMLGEDRYGSAYDLGSGWTQEEAITTTLTLGQ